MRSSDLRLGTQPLIDRPTPQGGLAKLLNLLRASTLCLRAAGAADIKVEKQVAYHAAHALRVYLRLHLVARVAALRQHRFGAPAAQVTPRAASARPCEAPG